MRRFLLVSATGWIAVLALGVEIALPYLLRSQSRSAPLRARMWPHYWLAYGLAILVLVHSSFVMGPAMRRGDLVGIWAATFALGLILLQLGLGLAMQSGSPSQRQLRQWHFRTMVAICLLLITHLWRNG
jgi:hypothetical protein